MPVTKSAKRALRKALRNKRENKRRKDAYRAAIRLFRKNPTKALLSKVFSSLDRAAKIHVIHKNRAAKLKAKLARLLATKSS